MNTPGVPFPLKQDDGLNLTPLDLNIYTIWHFEDRWMMVGWTDGQWIDVLVDDARRMSDDHLYCSRYREMNIYYL